MAKYRATVKTVVNGQRKHPGEVFDWEPNEVEKGEKKQRPSKTWEEVKSKKEYFKK